MKEDQRRISMLKEYTSLAIRSNADLRRDFDSTRTVTGSNGKDGVPPYEYHYPEHPRPRALGPENYIKF
jgi:hypothetical protein